MRCHHRSLLALVLGLSLLPTGWSLAAAGPAAAPAAGAGFVGSWQFRSQSPGQPPTPALLTFGADGTLFGSGLPVQPAGPGVVFISAGQGVWQPTGRGTAQATLILLAVDAHGSFRDTETDRLQLRLGPAGRTLQGQFVATVAEPTGQVEATLRGTVQGTRIGLGPPGPR